MHPFVLDFLVRLGKLLIAVTARIRHRDVQVVWRFRPPWFKSGTLFFVNFHVDLEVDFAVIISIANEAIEIRMFSRVLMHSVVSVKKVLIEILLTDLTVKDTAFRSGLSR